MRCRQAPWPLQATSSEIRSHEALKHSLHQSAEKGHQGQKRLDLHMVHTFPALKHRVQHKLERDQVYSGMARHVRCVVSPF